MGENSSANNKSGWGGKRAAASHIGREAPVLEPVEIIVERADRPEPFRPHVEMTVQAAGAVAIYAHDTEPGDLPSVVPPPDIRPL